MFELLGHFVAAQPADATFSTTNDIVTNAAPGTGFGLYNQGGQTVPGNTQSLWLKLKMPASTGVAGQRLMTLTSLMDRRRDGGLTNGHNDVRNTTAEGGHGEACHATGMPSFRNQYETQ